MLIPQKSDESARQPPYVTVPGKLNFLPFPDVQKRSPRFDLINVARGLPVNAATYQEIIEILLQLELTMGDFLFKQGFTAIRVLLLEIQASLLQKI